jgi:ornithine carbamoyltransferase
VSGPAFTPDPALAGRSVLTLRHHPPEAVAAVLDLADELKALPAAGWPHLLAGRVIALIFERPSTRTRVSFAAGIARLGGAGLVLSASDLQLGRGETIEDTAKVMGRWVDAVVLRTGPHATIEELDRHAGVPVVNGLTYEHHPCQALADAQTIRERFGTLSELEVAYLGDGNNCCVSLMIVGALTGMRVTAGCPPGYRPDREVVAWADAAARERGGWARVVEDPREAVAGAHVLYTDTWVSMGDEEREAERIAALEPYRVDEPLMGAAAPDAVAMHCLPAHHGHEITYEVLHGPRSAAWDQAENRMHAQAALLAHILG